MEFENRIHVMDINLHCSERVGEGYKVYILGEFIHHHQYGVVLLGFWQPLNEVQGNHLPCSFRNWQW